jgi:hypothetical protein
VCVCPFACEKVLFWEVRPLRQKAQKWSSSNCCKFSWQEAEQRLLHMCVLAAGGERGVIRVRRLFW